MPQFRAKARAVDLLGKGQIADLPTAISELWKNGYDAYGDDFEAFIYEKKDRNYSKPVFAISDDGRGMNRDEILSKWFVLGTDSKSRDEDDVQGEETLWKLPRPRMGEKGIGRLAVAYLGPQMLMLTKRRNFPLQAIFFDWRIMENYDLFLSDINIPIIQIDADNISTFFKALKEEFRLNFPAKEDLSNSPWKDQRALRQEIINECKELELPTYIVEDIISPLLADPENAHGTKFVIFEPNAQILDLQVSGNYDEEKEKKDQITINHTISTLIGLFNPFKYSEPKYNTRFWIKNDSGDRDLLENKQFFEPKDFEECDHLIEGSFDEFGKFKGKVRIYNQTIEHSFKPVKKRAVTNYGPFTIRLGYVNPQKDESIIPEGKKEIFEKKLKLYSGLFIYRDEVRVLPYGRLDTDFLEFEERRSRSAGDYFFSKRRMFGYLEITRRANPGLKDKSSREGFINNAAYRDFRIDLIAFFRDLANKYFGTKAEFDYKKVQQEELKRLSKAAERERQLEIEERKKFAQELSTKPDELKEFEQNFKTSIDTLQEGLKNGPIPYEKLQPLLDTIERQKVKVLNYKIAGPVRFKPSSTQERKYHQYQRQYDHVSVVMQEAEHLINEARLQLETQELFRQFESRAELYRNTIKGQFDQYEDRLEIVFRRIKAELDHEKKGFLSDFEEKEKAVRPEREKAKEILRGMQLLESIFTEAKGRMSERIPPYLNHLERLSFDVNEDELVGYYKDQFKVMEEEWEQTHELAQLGIAVEIIDHEFNALYSQLSINIQSFSAYLQPGNEARSRYLMLLSAFRHLENNYKLLQPLYRTTGRIRRDVTGKELFEYTNKFFEDRLKKNDIKFFATKAADAWTVFSYDSILKAVLINIINNAVYWLQPQDHRIIEFDSIDGSLLIMNSGEKIDDSALENIFKLFYSERPNGRGIGLYLAKKSLAGIGFDISATNDPLLNQLNGACFIITPIKPK